MEFWNIFILEFLGFCIFLLLPSQQPSSVPGALPWDDQTRGFGEPGSRRAPSRGWEWLFPAGSLRGHGSGFLLQPPPAPPDFGPGKAPKRPQPPPLPPGPQTAGTVPKTMVSDRAGSAGPLCAPKAHFKAALSFCLFVFLSPFLLQAKFLSQDQINGGCGFAPPRALISERKFTLI